jgi:murein DD-endopeptidase MepM/ murein hydrolase activator NlpD
MLAVALVAPGSAFAGGSASGSGGSTPKADKPPPIPVPREQLPGQTPGFRLPFGSGLEVRIDQGWNTPYSHNGKAAYAYDFGLYIGTPVLAAADGVVTYVHDGETACGGPELLRKANYVTINHPDGSATQYGHLSTVGVKVGDVVTAGQEIAKSGDTGYSHCMPHLHFARQYQGGPVTQSVSVYFEGYADDEFHSGQIVTAPSAPTAPCAAPSAEGKVAGDLLVGAYCGSYFGGAFDGPATFARRDAVINYDWRSHGPGGYWLDDAGIGFSARWSGRFVFASAGAYTIGVIASGAVIVSIDGVRVVDNWVDRGQPIEVLVSRSLGAGIHQVDVEYLSTAGHGLLKVGWGRLFADG